MDAVAISLAPAQEAKVEPDLKSLATGYIERAVKRYCSKDIGRAPAGSKCASAWSTVMDHLIRHLLARSAANALSFSRPNYRDSPSSLKAATGAASLIRSPTSISCFSIRGKSRHLSKVLTERLALHPVG